MTFIYIFNATSNENEKKEWFYNNSFLILGIWKLLGNTMGATSREGTAHPSGEPAFTPGLSEVRYARSLVFCEVFCRLLFVLWILITPLVSVNNSW